MTEYTFEVFVDSGHYVMSIYSSSHHMGETEAGLQRPLYLRNTSTIRRILRKILELHYNSAVSDVMEICSVIMKKYILIIPKSV